MRYKTLWLLPVLLLSTSCAPPGPSPGADTFCRIARPIYFDPDDKLTSQTLLSVIQHDETGAKLCGWPKPMK